MSTMQDTTNSKRFVYADMLSMLWKYQQGELTASELLEKSTQFGKWAISTVNGKVLPKKALVFSVSEKHEIVPTSKVEFKDVETGEQVDVDKSTVLTANVKTNPLKLDKASKIAKKLFYVGDSQLRVDWQLYWLCALNTHYQTIDTAFLGNRVSNPQKLQFAIKNWRTMSPQQLKAAYIRQHEINKPAKVTKPAKKQIIHETETLTAMQVAMEKAETVIA